MKDAEANPTDGRTLAALFGGIDRQGSGPVHILYLHGYGQSGAAFKGLIPEGKEYTHHLVDLPFHGAQAQERASEPPLSIQELSEAMRRYILTYCSGRPQVVAYSMGARAILSLLPHLHDLLGEVHLLAPDGLYRSAWYRAAVGSALGRQVFRALVSRWRMAYRWSEALSSIGLLGQSHVRLLKANIQSDEMAVRLVRTWSYMRELHPDLPLIGRLSAENRAPTLWLHLGRHDRVIVSEKVLRSVSMHGVTAHVREYPAGHKLLRSEIITQIFSPEVVPSNSEEMQSL